MSQIEERLIARIRARAEAGTQKYGKTMERDDLSLHDWIVHAQEDAMDFCVYLERIGEEVRLLEAILPRLQEALIEACSVHHSVLHSPGHKRDSDGLLIIINALHDATRILKMMLEKSTDTQKCDDKGIQK